MIERGLLPSRPFVVASLSLSVLLSFSAAELTEWAAKVPVPPAVASGRIRSATNRLETLPDSVQVQVFDQMWALQPLQLHRWRATEFRPAC